MESNTVTIKQLNGREKVVDTHEFSNVVNIRQERVQNWYPNITVETSNKETTIPSAKITEYPNPVIDVFLIEDNSASQTKHVIKKFRAMGIWESTSTHDKLETESKYTELLLPSNKNGAVRHSPMYRGMLARLPDGTVRTFGDFSRHSSWVQRKEEVIDTPVESADNTFTVETASGVITDCLNVRRSSQVFAVQRASGSTEYVSEITGASGGGYTVCVKHTGGEFNDEADYMITSLMNCTGVYESKGELCVVRHPDSTSTVVEPTVESIPFDTIESYHIKTPSGNIVQEIPEYIENGTEYIPTLKREVKPNLSREQLEALIQARITGSLTPADSDFKHIVDGYPELCGLLYVVSSEDELSANEHRIPYPIQIDSEVA